MRHPVSCAAPRRAAVFQLETTQDFCMYFWDEAEVCEWLDKKMILVYRSGLNTSREYKINMRQAVYVRAAIERMIEAWMLRNWG